jgi:hypothetical protein
MNDTQRTFIYQHTSQETAKVVEGYPWGFRLKTTIRYWIESKKNFGQRFASQTINPKTGKWCAPKFSTYSPIAVMFLDENNHVHHTGLGRGNTEESILKFKETHLPYLDEFQKEQLKELLAIERVMKHVTFTVVPSPIGGISLFSKDPVEVEKRRLMELEQEERKKQRELEFKKINRAIGYELSKITL